MDEGIISGKIGKQVLPELLQVSVLCTVLHREELPHICNKGCSKHAAAIQGLGQGGVRAYLEKNGLAQISDMGALEAMVDDVLAANPKQLQQFCGGKTKLQGFFAGYATFQHCGFSLLVAAWPIPVQCWPTCSAACRQVMKASKGLANPGLLNDVLMKKLDDARSAVAR